MLRWILNRKEKKISTDSIKRKQLIWSRIDRETNKIEMVWVIQTRLWWLGVKWWTKNSWGDERSFAFNQHGWWTLLILQK